MWAGQLVAGRQATTHWRANARSVCESNDRQSHRPEPAPVGTNVEPNWACGQKSKFRDDCKLLILLVSRPGIEPGTY